MPSATNPFAPRYTPPSPTNEELEWAELPTVDMSSLSTPEGRANLMAVVRDAMHTKGIMYVVNHGLSQGQNDRLIDIADVAFSQVPLDEKKRREAKPKEVGYWRVYKLRKWFHVENGVYDQVEMYSINHKVEMQDHPEALRMYTPEIMAFSQHNHHNILFPLLRLLALGLELPEDTLVDMHKFDGINKTWIRLQKYFPYSEEEAKDTKGVWMMDHTDFTSISILWSQPVSGLQVRSPDGSWHWVRHIPNALVVNAGEALEMLSGGFYKAAAHRVIQPPPDQRAAVRLGMFYFVCPDDSVKLAPLSQNAGDSQATQDAPTMAEWMAARLRPYAWYPTTDKETAQSEVA